MDSVLDVVRKEAEGTDCLQGEYPISLNGCRLIFPCSRDRLPDHPFTWRWNWCRNGYTLDFQDSRGIPRQDDVHLLSRA